MIRTRFAPSPTGFLHVGGARTALFNWLFAQKYGGEFLLRIEDTDISRSSEKNVQQIITDLQWLGINWNEEIIFQSKRIQIYQNYVKQLIETNHAYFCFCTPEELEAKRKSEYEYQNTGNRLCEMQPTGGIGKKSGSGIGCRRRCRKSTGPGQDNRIWRHDDTRTRHR